MACHGLSWLVMAHGNSPKARTATIAETAPDLQRSTRVRGRSVLQCHSSAAMALSNLSMASATERQVGGVLLWMRTELSEGNARALRG
jgi:hypothetical protein